MAKLTTYRHGKRFSKVELCEDSLTFSRSGPTIGLRVVEEDENTINRSYVLEISTEELDRLVEFRNRTEERQLGKDI